MPASSPSDDPVTTALDRVRSALTDRLHAELETTAAEMARVVAGVRADEAAGAAHRIEEATRATEALAGQIEAGHRDLAAAVEQADQLRLACEEARGELVEARAARDEALRQRDDALRHLEAADGLAAGLRGLDESCSFGAALDGLLALAARDAGRAAVFLVRGDRIEAWRASGFANDTVLLPQAYDGEPSVIGQAVGEGRGCEHRDGDGWPLPGFAVGDEPRWATALPVTVGGAVVAVLYADVPSAHAARWPGTLDVTARYAGRVLEGLTVRQATTLRGVRSAPGQTAGV